MSARTRRVASAAHVIAAELGRSGTALGIAEALECAGLLLSPEVAAELARSRTVRAPESVAKLRALLARQRGDGS